MEEVENTEEWPQLVFWHGKDMENQTFCSMRNKQRVCSVPELRGKKVWTCCHGWLVLSNGGSSRPRHFSLWNPVTLESIDFPPLIPTHVKECVLSSEPSDPRSAVILLDNVSQCFWVFRLHKQDEQQRWSRINYKYNINTSINYLKNPVYCDDKLYAVSNNWELVDFTELSAARILLPLPHSRGVPASYFLIDSSGELFVVVSLFEDRVGPLSVVPPHGVTRFEVYKLDLSALRWERVMTLGDRAFFRCRFYAFSCPTTFVYSSGIRGNHIYFTTYKERCFYSYDIVEETISVSLPCPNLPTPWDPPVWVMPNIRLINYSDEAAANRKEKEEQGTEEEERWEKKKLQLSDLKKTTPLLLYFQRDRGCLNIVDPDNSERHISDAPQSLWDATICHCKNGWLLLCKRTASSDSFSVSFLNPFTKEVIPYPDLSLETLSSSLFDFSSPPTHSQGCIVIVVTFFENNEVDVNICYSRKQGWINKIKSRNNSLCEDLNFKSHVYCDGAFYFLDPSGKVGVLSLQLGELGCEWRVLEELKKPYLSYCECFLAECDGDLYSLFVRDAGGWVKVFKLNRATMVWNIVESLGKYSMYVSRLSTLLIEERSFEKENRIYFPRFSGDPGEIVSYSLTTRKYCHSSGTCHDYYGMREPLLCCWIQPS